MSEFTPEEKAALPPSPGHWEFKRMDVALSSLEDNPEQDEKVWGNCDLRVQTVTQKKPSRLKMAVSDKQKAVYKRCIY